MRDFLKLIPFIFIVISCLIFTSVLTGVYALFTFSVYLWLQRNIKHWKGEPAIFHDQAFLIEESSLTNNQVQIILGLNVSQWIDLQVKKENNWDRLAKRLMVSNEISLGGHVDEKLYLMIDKSRDIRQLKSNVSKTEFIPIINALFEHGINKIQLIGQRLVIQFECKKEEQNNKCTTISNLMLEMKAFIDRESPHVDTEEKGDDFYVKSAALVTLSSALFFTGVTSLFSITTDPGVYTLDIRSMIIVSTMIGLAGWIVFVLVSIFIMDRTSRTHIVLGEVMTAGLIGCLLYSFSVVRNFNVDYDNSDPAIHYVKVNSKHESRGSKSKTFSVYIDRWDSENGEWIQVDPETYYAIKNGDFVEITEHKGALGFKWIENIRPSSIKGDYI